MEKMGHSGFADKFKEKFVPTSHDMSFFVNSNPP